MKQTALHIVVNSIYKNTGIVTWTTPRRTGVGWQILAYFMTFLHWNILNNRSRTEYFASGYQIVTNSSVYRVYQQFPVLKNRSSNVNYIIVERTETSNKMFVRQKLCCLSRNAGKNNKGIRLFFSKNLHIYLLWSANWKHISVKTVFILCFCVLYCLSRQNLAFGWQHFFGLIFSRWNPI